MEVTQRFVIAAEHAFDPTEIEVSDLGAVGSVDCPLERLASLLRDRGLVADRAELGPLHDRLVVDVLWTQLAGLAQIEDSTLWLVRPQCDLATVKRLLKAGGDVNIPNASKNTGGVDETALDNAEFWERDEIAKLLIKAGGKRQAEMTPTELAPNSP